MRGLRVLMILFFCIGLIPPLNKMEFIILFGFIGIFYGLSLICKGLEGILDLLAEKRKEQSD